MDFRFGKDKKLKSRKQIDKLFAEGDGLYHFPIRAVFLFDCNREPEFKIGVSVPKKKFKKAVDRNLIKRRMREAFRLNQNSLQPACKLDVMFIYIASQLLDYQQIEKAMIALIADLNLASAEDI